MKILAISLLRLGDLILHRPLFLEAKRKTPGLEIHVLINEQFGSANELFPEVTQFHYFPRTKLQQMVGNAHAQMGAPVEAILQLTESLSSQSFDQVWNLTHNRLAAGLTEMISAPVKKGLVAKADSFEPMNNLWLRFFNQQFSLRNQSYFHYVEYLAGVFGYQVKPQVADIRNSNLILIQPLTSDSKKDWGLPHFRALLDFFYANMPGFQFKILAAEFERKQLSKYFNDEEMHIANLGEAQSLVRQARLLVTGDTAIAHLAAGEATPVICLAMGSSDPYRTAPYSVGSFVLHPKVSCSPCSHTQSCRQLSHLCGSELSVQRLGQFIEGYLLNDRLRINEAFQGTLVQVLELTEDRGHLHLLGASDELYMLEKNVLARFLGGQNEYQLTDIPKMAVETQQEFVNMTVEIRTQLLMVEQAFLSAQEETATGKLRTYLRSLPNQIYFQSLSELGTTPFPSSLQFLGACSARLKDLEKQLMIRNEIIHGGKNGNVLNTCIEAT